MIVRFDDSNFIFFAIFAATSLRKILRNDTIVRDFLKKHTTFNQTYVDAVLTSRINVSQVRHNLII